MIHDDREPVAPMHRLIIAFVRANVLFLITWLIACIVSILSIRMTETNNFDGNRWTYWNLVSFQMNKITEQ